MGSRGDETERHWHIRIDSTCQGIKSLWLIWPAKPSIWISTVHHQLTQIKCGTVSPRAEAWDAPEPESSASWAPSLPCTARQEHSEKEFLHTTQRISFFRQDDCITHSRGESEMCLWPHRLMPGLSGSFKKGGVTHCSMEQPWRVVVRESDPGSSKTSINTFHCRPSDRLSPWHSEVPQYWGKESCFVCKNCEK